MKVLVCDDVTKEELFQLPVNNDEALIVLGSSKFTFENNSYIVVSSDVNFLPFSPIHNSEPILNIFVIKL